MNSKLPRQTDEAFAWSLRLQHHLKLQIVHAAITGIIAFSDSSLHEHTTDITTASIKKAWKENRIRKRREVCNILMHMKRLRSVHREFYGKQNLALPLHYTNTDDENINAFDNSEFLGHQRRLQIVHYDVLQRSTSDVSPLLSQSRSEVSQNTGADPMEEEVDYAIAQAREEIKRLKEEVRGVKLVANAARIRYEAREKELKVVQFQHQKLNKQFKIAEFKSQHSKLEAVDDATRASEVTETTCESSVTNEELSVTSVFSSQLAVLLKTTGSEGRMGDANVKKLKKDLREAELKVEMLSVELNRRKAQAEEAEERLEEREADLKKIISQCNALEQEHESHKQMIAAEKRHALPSPAVSRENSKEEGEENVSNIFRNKKIAFLNLSSEEGGSANLDLIASFDGSHLTSVCGSNYMKRLIRRRVNGTIKKSPSKRYQLLKWNWLKQRRRPQTHKRNKRSRRLISVTSFLNTKSFNRNTIP